MRGIARITAAAVSVLLLRAIPAGAQVTATPSQEPTLVEGIAAIVGNEVILKGEVALQAIVLMQQQGIDLGTATPEQHQQFREQALQNLIDETVLVARARRDTVEVERGEVDAAVSSRIEELKQNVGGEESFQQALRSEGFTEQEFRRRLREQMTRQLLGQKLLAMQDFRRPTAVSRREAAAFIRERGEEFLIVLRQIFLKPPADADPNLMARRRIEELRERIVNGGEDFAAVARAESEDPGSRENGGMYEDAVEQGYWTASVDSTVWNTPVGMVSQPVRSEFGWHIVEVLERDDKKAKMRHILIRVQESGTAIEALSGTISAIRAEIERGVPAAELVERFSEAEDASERRGYYRLVSRTDPSTVAGLPQGWLSILQSMETGKWEGPLESPEGVHFIQRMPVTDEMVNLVLQYDFPIIERVIQQVRQAEAIQAWLTELRNETYIEIKKD